ncbi:MAG: polymerase sigma-54 factor [Oscillospiraceae bacterium]|nr:polymerase sigma-54 factor [Oscillospiraceae bacterium]
MELNLSIKQTQTLSPQMLQTLEILQMSTLELKDYVEHLAQENPVMDLDDAPPPEEFTVIRRKLEWLEATDTQNSYYHRQDEGQDEDPMVRCSDHSPEETLYFQLLSQLHVLRLKPQVEKAALMILESLNDDGWLDEELCALPFPAPVAQEALKAVQSMEPAGVGARNLSECLTLQLRRMPEPHKLALRIAEKYLDALSKNHYHQIAKALGVSQEEVRAACDEIRSLNPRPGAGFATKETLPYIDPDIVIASFGDHFELFLNDRGLPAIKLSSYYSNLFKQTDDTGVKEYLSDKLRQAKWVVRCIEQRRKTLRSCAETILKRQQRFFEQGVGHLAPMTLADVARDVGVHESTVSRAIREKYIQCAHGIFPLNYFFSRGLGSFSGEGTSPDSAKALLRRLVEHEDKKKPLSDQKLCELMAKEDVEISRRTVAKYRDELNLPAATGRKQL